MLTSNKTTNRRAVKNTAKRSARHIVEVGNEYGLLVVKELKSDRAICECSKELGGCGKYPVIRALNSLESSARGAQVFTACKVCQRTQRKKLFSPHISRPPGFKLPPRPTPGV